MTNIRKEGIENHYRKHRQLHPDAITWDMVIHRCMNGDEFGKPLKVWQWVLLTKASKNTIIKWLPLIKDYVDNSSILNEPVADAIVRANIKQKGNA